MSASKKHFLFCFTVFSPSRLISRNLRACQYLVIIYYLSIIVDSVFVHESNCTVQLVELYCTIALELLSECSVGFLNCSRNYSVDFQLVYEHIMDSHFFLR